MSRTQKISCKSRIFFAINQPHIIKNLKIKKKFMFDIDFFRTFAPLFVIFFLTIRNLKPLTNYEI